jgi:para-aminobenzoate synthetase component 2
MSVMRILVIDNYDSFVYNLVQYLGELGEDCTVWRNDAAELGTTAADLVSRAGTVRRGAGLPGARAIPSSARTHPRR